jgi:hypothetical protein
MLSTTSINDGIDTKVPGLTILALANDAKDFYTWLYMVMPSVIFDITADIFRLVISFRMTF